MRVALLIVLIPLFFFGQKNNKKNNKTPVEEGYILYAPLFSKTTLLIDRNGQIKHTWKSKYNPAQSVYLLDNGILLHTGNDSSSFFFNGGGVIEKINARSEVVWRYVISDSLNRQHHDVYPMPNGNILALVWEKIPRREAIKCGRDSTKCGNYIWSEKIIEIKPVGSDKAELVWQWRVWDHLVQDRDPAFKNYANITASNGRLNINCRASVSEDWLHFNSITYDPQEDEILISNRNLCEIYIIDHSTSTAEAAGSKGGRSGRGGDILYRWGNDQNFAINHPQQLFGQHHATWLYDSNGKRGDILLFNNGTQRGGENEYSEILQLNVQKRANAYPLNESGAYEPTSASWRYLDTIVRHFFSYNVSSAQRLKNGNTLICEGAKGRFFEVNLQGETVWQFPLNKVTKTSVTEEEKNPIFRCTFYTEEDPKLRFLAKKKLNR